MTPKEVIARAIARGDYGHYGNFCEWEDESPDLRAAYFNMADAVIDALEKMEVTDKMFREYWKPRDYAETAELLCHEVWRAMVGAMRDE